MYCLVFFTVSIDYCLEFFTVSGDYCLVFFTDQDYINRKCGRLNVFA